MHPLIRLNKQNSSIVIYSLKVFYIIIVHIRWGLTGIKGYYTGPNEH